MEVKKETDVKYVHYGDIHTNIADEIDKNNNLPFINEIYKEYDELKLDDVIVADASEDYKGIADAAVIISNLPYTIIAGLHTIALRPTSLIKGYFLYHIFKTENFKRFGYKIGTGLKVFGISYNNLAKYKVYYPQEIEEQEKIIGILSNLTNSINLHERKCEELALIKKALLQKLFPKKDEIKPEVRYKNFSDAWEQRKLGGFLQEYSIKSKIENEYPLLSSTNKGMEYREGRTASESNIGYKILKINDLVLSPQNLWLGNININTLVTGIVSPSYKTLKINNLSLYFLLPQLKTKRMLEKYKQVSVQGASVVRRNLDFTEFMNISLVIPTNKEQEQIGEFFKQLDSLIALHQRKLDHLELMKKGLLQQMFV